MTGLVLKAYKDSQILRLRVRLAFPNILILLVSNGVPQASLWSHISEWGGCVRWAPARYNPTSWLTSTETTQSHADIVRCAQQNLYNRDNFKWMGSLSL